MILLLSWATLGLVLGGQASAAKPHKDAAAGKVVAITSLRVIQEKEGPAVEILSTGPLTPEIHLLKEPARLVIDLPNARIDKDQKKIDVQANEIRALRMNQFQKKPPVARVVVDLLAARPYKWDATGNRLVVRLGKSANSEQSPFETAAVSSPTVVGLTPAAQPMVKAVRAAGPLAVASDTGRVGTSFHAGADTAVLSLSSGGEVHVCPGTLVTITPSANRHNLLLGLSTGAMEAHLELDTSTDLVMTPDFRIALEGPGEFHFAFSTDQRGDTCVRALAGNTGAVSATELLGDGTYRVKATDQLVFRGGRVDRVDMNVPLECGCPPPLQNIDRANNVPAQVPTTGHEQPDPADTRTVAEASPATAAQMGTPAGNSPNQMHVQVSAPLVFRATGPPPAPVEDVEAAPAEQPNAQTKSAATAGASAAAAKGSGLTVELEPPKRNIFRRIGGWFAKVFH